MEFNWNNFGNAIQHTTAQVQYWHKRVEELGTDESFVAFPPDYPLSPHTLVYVNLNEGFPHELMFGHWCYVVKITYSKVLVIPATSYRGKTSKDNMLITTVFVDEDGAERDEISLLYFSEMRFIDKQRIDKRKSPVEVMTERKHIMNRMVNYISGGE